MPPPLYELMRLAPVVLKIECGYETRVANLLEPTVVSHRKPSSSLVLEGRDLHEREGQPVCVRTGDEVVQ